MEFTTRFGLHFQTTRLQGSCQRQGPEPYGPDTRPGMGLDQEDSGRGHTRRRSLPIHHSSRRQQEDGGFGAGLFPVHSPLLRESLLVSFPPLTDMLKFSG